MMEKRYKIRRKKDGKFMTKRGSFPTWTAEGHVYNTLAACKSAAKTRWKSWREAQMGWDHFKTTVEIVEFELIPTGEIIEFDN